VGAKGMREWRGEGEKRKRKRKIRKGGIYTLRLEANIESLTPQALHQQSTTLSLMLIDMISTQFS
jgi:hypothetical protein